MYVRNMRKYEEINDKYSMTLLQSVLDLFVGCWSLTHISKKKKKHLSSLHGSQKLFCVYVHICLPTNVPCFLCFWCDLCGLICTSCLKYVSVVHPSTTMNSSAHSIALRNQVSLTHKYYPVPIFNSLNPHTLVVLLQISLLYCFLYFTIMHRISLDMTKSSWQTLRVQQWTL